MVKSRSLRLHAGLLSGVVSLAIVGCDLKANEEDAPASGNGGSAGSSGNSGSGGKAGASGGKAGGGSGGSTGGSSGSSSGNSGRGGSGGTAPGGKAGDGGRAGSGEGGDENQAGSDAGGSSNPSGGSGGTEPQAGEAGSESGGSGGSSGSADTGGEGGSAGAEDSCSSPSECDDDDACTTDGCDGVCTHAPVTVADTNVCTTDTCDPESGVAHTPTSGGSCTLSGGGSGVCSAGNCVPPGCGNGVAETGEGCDDDNTDNFDGCNSACQDEVSVGPDAHLLLEDDGYNGTLASMTCADLLVSSTGDGLVDLVSVEVGITHTWIGDLTIKLVSPENTVVTLVSRPGQAEAADDGANTVYGNGANLDADLPIVFVDGGATSAESMGVGLGSGGTACEDDGLCIYAPNAGTALPGTLASFVGEAAAGNWRLCVGDSQSSDPGSIESVVLSVVQ